MKNRTAHAQDIYLEQAAVGELAPQTLDRLQSQPGFSREAFSQASDRLKAENAAFHRRFDRRKMLESIRAKAFAGEPKEDRVSAFALDIKERAVASAAEPATGGEHLRKFSRWPFAVAAALPLFFIIALVMRMSIPGATGSGDIEPGIRTKGLEPRIFIYRDLGDGQVELLQDRDSVRQNDKLQISYLATGRNYGAIISIDGNSVITLHYPENSNMLPRLQPTDEVYLPYGYLLDDAPDFERFLFVTSEEAFDVRQLMASIAPQLRGSAWNDRGVLEFPEGFTVHRVDLIKPRGTR
jgi:hypothetical protein